MQLFKNVVIGDNDEDKLEDLAGYTGNIHQHRMDKLIKRVPLEEEQLMRIIHAKNKLKEIAMAFREID